MSESILQISDELNKWRILHHIMNKLKICMYLDWLEEKIDYEKKIGATKSSKNLLVSLILNETIFYTLYFSEAFNSKVFAMLILRKFAQKEVERSKN